MKKVKLLISLFLIFVVADLYGKRCFVNSQCPSGQTCQGKIGSRWG